MGSWLWLSCTKQEKNKTTGKDEANIAGKLKVWANDATKRKQKKVVFVQISTKLFIASKTRTADANSEKERMTQYLNQALIELHPDSQIVDLDLTAVAQFSNYVKNKEVNKVSSVAGGPKLEDFLKARLTAQFSTTYDSFFKAFYFDEDGYHPGQGNLSGYSAFGADYVVVFKSANDQTAAHEMLHSLNLAHSFTNKEASSHALFTYEYKKTDNLLDYSHHIGAGGNNSNRCALWYWQWKKANGSIP